MSVVVNIKQNPKKNKKIGLKFLNGWLRTCNLCFGVPNQAYCLENYEGKEDLRNQLLIIYNPKSLGRGFSFTIEENYDVELVLNFPATKNDIILFYKFIDLFCSNFKIKTFIHEGEEYSLDKIESLMNATIAFNKKLVKNDLESDLTIFGCIYPIVLEKDFIKKIKQLNEDEAYQLYEEYLNKKQKEDYYFAKPIIYEDKNKKYYAKYALTENVPTIFPIETYLPFGYDQNLEKNIKTWNVSLIENKNGKFDLLDKISYDNFCKLVDLSKYPKFDEKHIIITFNQEILEKTDKYLIDKAKIELENWLSDIRELGRKPVKIEYTNTFEENGIKCYIFKYKKTLLSKWFLGIVSDSGTFSEMKEYNKNTEVEDAKRIIKLLQEIWKKTVDN